MTVLFLTDDLMFSSRVSIAAQMEKVAVISAPTVAQLLARAPATGVPLILLDLSAAACRLEQIPELVSELRRQLPASRLLAFGPHVWEDKLAAAREAGCDEVLARGQFNQQMNAILRRAVTGDG